MESSAYFSDNKTYRYLLERVWDKNYPLCTFVMLNPSVADETDNDPTIRRCIGFAKGWGFGGFRVINLFAFVATSPADLLQKHKEGVDIVGPSNVYYLRYASFWDGPVIYAWGANVMRFRSRIAEVEKILIPYEVCR